MKKLHLLALLLIFALPLLLNAQSFTYLDDPDYRRLSQSERTRYLENLEAAMQSFQTGKTSAIEQNEELEIEIERLRRLLAETDSEIAEVMARLGVTEEDIAKIRTSLQYYRDQLDGWERRSDDELWRLQASFKELEEDYGKTKAQKLAQLPEFQREFSDLDRRFVAINQRLTGGRQYINPVAGDTAASLRQKYGYSHEQWMVIYRANRDQMRNPDDVRPGQRLIVPAFRGQTAWTVWRGESLWKISQYPEIYGTGTKWPVIYMDPQNRKTIGDNPDLIFPNQKLNIPQPPPTRNPQVR